MNAFLDTWNLAGDRAIALAWPLLVQSSVLVAILLVLERLLRQRLRPAARYALWLLVPLKLLLPPSFALPSSPAYWLPHPPAPAIQLTGSNVEPASTALAAPATAPRPASAVASPDAPPAGSFPVPPPAPNRLRLGGALLLVWGVGSLALLAGIAARTRQLRRLTTEAGHPAPELLHALEEARAQLGLRRPAGLRLVADGHSPALCGLRRPVVLLPRSLPLRLTPGQLRAVLLHELVHARRADIWVNAFQTLLQLVWWWHPLVWLANARLRAVREEAVDDTVAFELGPDDDSYPVALLEVARCALARPVLSLGLVGILESRSALRTRIERLLESPPSRPPRLGVRGLVALAATGLLLLPMARGTPDQQLPAASPLLPAVEQPAAGARPLPEGNSPAAGQTLDQARAQLAVWLTRYTEENPAVIGLRRRITELEKQNEARAREASVAADNTGPRLRVDARLLAFGPEATAALGLLETTNPPPAGGNYVPPLVHTNGRSPRLDTAELGTFLAALGQRPDVDTVTETRLDLVPGRETEIPLVAFSTNHPTAISLQLLAESTGSQRRLRVGFVARTTDLLELSHPPAPGASPGNTPAASSPDAGQSPVHAVNAIGYINRIQTNEVVLGEGQAYLLAAPSRSETVRMSDKVVLLGDLPLVGRLFRHDSTGTRPRHELVLVTATWVDAEGRPLPSPEAGK